MQEPQRMRNKGRAGAPHPALSPIDLAAVARLGSRTLFEGGKIMPERGRARNKSARIVVESQESHEEATDVPWLAQGFV